jgi:hypothetical protein
MTEGGHPQGNAAVCLPTSRSKAPRCAADAMPRSPRPTSSISVVRRYFLMSRRWAPEPHLPPPGKSWCRGCLAQIMLP